MFYRTSISLYQQLTADLLNIFSWQAVTIKKMQVCITVLHSCEWQEDTDNTGWLSKEISLWWWNRNDWLTVKRRRWSHIDVLFYNKEGQRVDIWTKPKLCEDGKNECTHRMMYRGLNLLDKISMCHYMSIWNNVNFSFIFSCAQFIWSFSI